MASAQHPLPTHSYLEIYDVASRTHRVVKEFPFVIEAPNWTPDGKWLVVNKDGKLYTLSSGEITGQKLTQSIVDNGIFYVYSETETWRLAMVLDAFA